MARTLKASGIASELVMCIAVDDDNTTIKEFVNGWTVGSGMTASGTVDTSTDTWNGSTVPYININGRLDIAAPPSVSAPAGVLIVFNSTGDASSASLSGNGASGIEISANGSGQWRLLDPGSTCTFLTTTVTTTRSYSMALNSTAANAKSYYALEGGTASAADTDNASPYGELSSDAGLHSLGGISGVGSFACQVILALVIDREITMAEFNAIHADPFGELFEAGGGSAVPLLMQMYSGS